MLGLIIFCEDQHSISDNIFQEVHTLSISENDAARMSSVSTTGWLIIEDIVYVTDYSFDCRIIKIVIASLKGVTFILNQFALKTTWLEPDLI